MVGQVHVLPDGAQEIEAVDLRALVELDFYGGGSENAPTARLRRAEMSVLWPRHDLELVAGQTWDLVQPLNPAQLNYMAAWFSGNIGFHHIHHLSPRIPNYNLERCHQADPLFQTVKPIGLLASLKSLTFRLWDEQRSRLVGYRRLREIRRQQKRSSPPIES